MFYMLLTLHQHIKTAGKKKEKKKGKQQPQVLIVHKGYPFQKQITHKKVFNTPSQLPFLFIERQCQQVTHGPPCNYCKQMISEAEHKELIKFSNFPNPFNQILNSKLWPRYQLARGSTPKFNLCCHTESKWLTMSQVFLNSLDTLVYQKTNSSKQNLADIMMQKCIGEPQFLCFSDTFKFRNTTMVEQTRNNTNIRRSEQ